MQPGLCRARAFCGRGARGGLPLRRRRLRGFAAQVDVPEFEFAASAEVEDSLPSPGRKRPRAETLIVFNVEGGTKAIAIQTSKPRVSLAVGLGRGWLDPAR